MAIRFTCKCGKTLEVDAILGGHEVRCPACNTNVRAPQFSQTTSSRLEETPIEHIKARIAEGLERDQLTTKVTVVAASWFIILLAAMFIGAFMEFSIFIMWLFIWVPLIALLEAGAYLTITAHRWGRPLIVVTAIIGLGVSWTYIFLGVASFTGDYPTPILAAITFMCSFLNVLACLALIWFFGRKYLSILAELDEDASHEAPATPIVKDIKPQ